MSADAAVFLWAAYAMGIALVASELGLLYLRGRAIRGHLGWRNGFLGRRRKAGRARDDAGAHANR